jgi:hypothetical protein
MNPACRQIAAVHIVSVDLSFWSLRH